MTKFHDYEDCRATNRRLRGQGAFSEAAKRMDLKGFLEYYANELSLICQDPSQQSIHDFSSYQGLKAGAEISWLLLERPYINVYPVVEDVVRKINLDVKWQEVTWPYDTIAFRFAVCGSSWGDVTGLVTMYDVIGNEEFQKRVGIKADRISAIGKALNVFTRCQNSDGTFGGSQIPIGQRRNKEIFVRDTIERIELEEGQLLKTEGDGDPMNLSTISLWLRLVVFTALVWKDPDVVSPMVSESLKKKLVGKSEDAKQALMEKSYRQNGWGFDLGRKLQEERDVSPHWRMPHAAIYHTGKGRTVPKVIFRSGSLVKHSHGLQVPTGFLGPETEEERQYVEKVKVRTPLKPKERWFVLKRDNFTCQLCGASRSTGAILEIDHKVPVANGGSNDFENLWVLCFECNRGKGVDAV